MMQRRKVLGGADVVHGAAAAATAARVRLCSPTTRWAQIPSLRLRLRTKSSSACGVGRALKWCSICERSGDATPGADCRLSASRRTAPVTTMEVVAKLSRRASGSSKHGDVLGARSRCGRQGDRDAFGLRRAAADRTLPGCWPPSNLALQLTRPATDAREGQRTRARDAVINCREVAGPRLCFLPAQRGPRS
jgi:hypothetical protein